MNYKNKNIKILIYIKMKKKKLKNILKHDKKIEYKFKESKEYKILIKFKRPLRVIYSFIILR